MAVVEPAVQRTPPTTSVAVPAGQRLAVPRVVASHGLAALGMSLPWPLLLVLVWQETHSGLVLGLAGAARMAPYVGLSWLAGRVADALPRGRVLRATLLSRLAALGVAWVALGLDHLVVAVVACTLAVALGTPAFPALAASMPGLAEVSGSRAAPAALESPGTRATDLLVTVEVASFVAGPALGGLLLVPEVGWLVPATGVGLTAAAWLAVRRLDLPSPRTDPADRVRLGEVLRGARVGAVLWVMSLVNFVVALVAVALVPMAEDYWSASPSTYGVASSVLGFGAVAAPLLGRAVASHLRIRLGLAVLGVALVTVAPVPAVGWALPPLAVIGAMAVDIEAAATGVLQARVADRFRASVLGLADTTMVAAALAGSLVGPILVERVGPQLLLAAVAALAITAAWLLNPHGNRGAAKESVAQGLPSDAFPQ